MVVSELCVAGGKLSKASEAQKQGVAKRRPRSARNDYVSRVQPDRARLQTKASSQAKLKQLNKFRGVAKVVSRQFRVLETVGSSPAASTIFSGFDRKKTAR